jgi:tRNA-2-methylthio-N6-dimethylallyladenosine synthase
MVEGPSHKKPDTEWYGRNTQNQVIVFPNKDFKKGDYVNVKVLIGNTSTLIGEVV